MYRLNYRNEAVTLRALLKLACALLRRHSITMPRELEQWYLAQRNLTRLRKPRPKVNVQSAITVDSVQQAIMRGDITVESDLEAEAGLWNREQTRETH